MVLKHIPARANCDLTYIVDYNPLSNANLMHLQPLQKKTAKQIHWIVIFPELFLLNEALDNFEKMRMRSSEYENLCCLADFQYAMNMWQALFRHMSIVFPSSLENPGDVTLFTKILRACVQSEPHIVNVNKRL